MGDSKTDILSPRVLSDPSVLSRTDAVENEPLPTSIKDSLSTAPKASIDPGKSGDTVESKDSSDEVWNAIIYIPDIEVGYSKREKLTMTMKRLLGVLPSYTSTELDWEIKRITNCCLKHINDLHEIHLKRTAAIKMIDDVILRMDMFHIRIQHVVHLTWSIMSILHHFQMRFRSGTKSIITWTRQKQFQDCMKLYRRLIKVFPKTTYPMVLKAMLLFYTAGRLWSIGRMWSIEFPLTEMICNLLLYYSDVEDVIEEILATAENCSLNSDTEARVLIKILLEVLDKVKFTYISKNLMKRLLNMFEKSIMPRGDYHSFRYWPMRVGLKTSLMNITKSLGNRDLLNLMSIIVEKITYRDMEDDTLLEFGNIVEYAALRYQTRYYVDFIPKSLFENLMTMMLSENSNHHLFAHRIIQNIMDRHGNKGQFQNPRVFLRGVYYNIRIARFSARDKIYYKRHRTDIYKVLMAGLQNHYDIKINLDNIYTYLAIICVELPSSYVAVSIVSFAMSMQEFILRTNPPNTVACHHVHAIVMSLLSLVCYVHKAEVFYNYVTSIMERRSDLAPHLNPPLKVVYKYAQHHILWNKPDLFFEEWEARYGLWKCFRTNKADKKQDSKDDVPNTRIFI